MPPAVHEHEVKFHLPDPAEIRRLLLDSGASSNGRMQEVNLIFDDDRQRLLRAGELLRLRRDRHVLLTHKSPVAGAGSEVKTMREREVRVEDFDRMRSILEALGFHVVRIYEKWRETFLLGTVHVCLDALPFGDFLEIEGDHEGIREAASRLALNWDGRILLNYQELFNVIKSGYGLSFNDITFDNFTGIRVDMQPFYQQITAGSRQAGSRSPRCP